MVEFITNLFNWFVHFVLHMDKELPKIVSDIGLWSYAAIFVVIFIETGVVIMPFLPGDSLLFAAGAVAGNPSSGMNPVLLYILVAAAAILGDTANYWIGHYIGPKVFTTGSRWFKKEHLDRTHAFYEKHGGKTIFLARFIPIIRTFAPFVAGIGKMRYGYFISYNIFGGLIWTAIFLWTGYFFGTQKFVQDNFSMIVIAIILISFIPVLWEFLRGKINKTKPSAEMN